ncbi:hypothetical protein Q7P37_009946 [Cladosporium fusiforme]
MPLLVEFKPPTMYANTPSTRDEIIKLAQDHHRANLLVATFTPVATVVTLTNTVPWNITLELSSRLSIFIETDKSHAVVTLVMHTSWRGLIRKEIKSLGLKAVFEVGMATLPRKKDAMRRVANVCAITDSADSAVCKLSESLCLLRLWLSEAGVPLVEGMTFTCNVLILALFDGAFDTRINITCADGSQFKKGDGFSMIMMISRWAWRENGLDVCTQRPESELVCPRVLSDETSPFSTLAIFTTYLLLSIASYAAAFVWSPIVMLRLMYAVLSLISILTVLMTVAVSSALSLAASPHDHGPHMVRQHGLALRAVNAIRCIAKVLGEFGNVFAASEWQSALVAME